MTGRLQPRWGTRLHDDFWLPVTLAWYSPCVERSRRRAGYSFAPEWFAPHFESPDSRGSARLPNAARARAALMPRALARCWVRSQRRRHRQLRRQLGGKVVSRWPASTTSAMSLLVNGWRSLPRYRYRRRICRWRALSCLAALTRCTPRSACIVPLVFDVHDSWNGPVDRWLHVPCSHPGGRNYMTACRLQCHREAEARRRAWLSPDRLYRRCRRTAPARQSGTPAD